MGLYKNKLTKHRSFRHQQDGKQECSHSGDEALQMDGADHDRTVPVFGDVLGNILSVSRSSNNSKYNVPFSCAVLAMNIGKFSSASTGINRTHQSPNFP